MPYGTSAPGKVLPPPVVQVRASTREARSGTWLRMLPFLAPGGRLPLGTGRWQSVTWPVRVTRQVPPGFPAVSGLAGAPDPRTAELGLADGLGLGCGDALGLGVTLAWASPESMSVLAAVTVIR